MRTKFKTLVGKRERRRIILKWDFKKWGGVRLRMGTVGLL
jgi:hypothetical protein